MARPTASWQPGLPPEWYFDEGQFHLERELFGSGWHLMGPARGLDLAGDRVAGRIGGTPVVAVRQVNGDLRGFVNICRHRGFPVVHGDGNSFNLQCGYHGWTYGLDGCLQAAPNDGWDESTRPFLREIVLDDWQGMLWGNVDGSTHHVAEAHPELAHFLRLADVDLNRFDLVRRVSSEIRANWKLWVENAAECYHCSWLHPNSFSAVWDTRPSRFRFFNEGAVSAQLGTSVRHGQSDCRSENRFFYVYLFPSSVLVIDRFMMITASVVPLSAHSTEIQSSLLLSDECDDDLAAWLAMYDQTTEEDIEAIQLQHTALASGAADTGLVDASRESGVAHFHSLLRTSLGGLRPGTKA